MTGDVYKRQTCAYAVGMLIGKHKLAPVLSPKKSIEGAIGGVVGAALIGYIYGMFFWLDPPECALLCAVGAVVSQVGDLAASAIKRNPVSYTHLDVYKRQRLYSAGRQQGQRAPAHAESSDCLDADRPLARGQLEFCGVGALLRRSADCGEISAAQSDGKTAADWKCVYDAAGSCWLGILFQPYLKFCHRLSACYVLSLIHI